jgi:hypothetical protein
MKAYMHNLELKYYNELVENNKNRLNDHLAPLNLKDLIDKELYLREPLIQYITNLLLLTKFEIEGLDDDLSFLIHQQKRLCIKLMLGIGYQKDEWMLIVMETLKKINFQSYIE